MSEAAAAPWIRGSGTTTSQMRAAPPRAVFIWPQRRTLDYANALAARLGRTDLTITTPQILDDGGRRLLGRRLTAIVVDHACELSHRQMDLLHELRLAARI